MDLYPSIDLLGGRVVRLLRGNYDAETVYDEDAVAVARGFERAGARWIHVVDLDAARDGGDANLGVIEAICANVSVRVQSGGGVRSIEDASEVGGVDEPFGDSPLAVICRSWGARRACSYTESIHARIWSCHGASASTGGRASKNTWRATAATRSSRSSKCR